MIKKITQLMIWKRIKLSKIYNKLNRQMNFRKLYVLEKYNPRMFWILYWNIIKNKKK